MLWAGGQENMAEKDISTAQCFASFLANEERGFRCTFSPFSVFDVIL